MQPEFRLAQFPVFHGPAEGKVRNMIFASEYLDLDDGLHQRSGTRFLKPFSRRTNIRLRRGRRW
jgi:hypothetical protein